MTVIIVYVLLVAIGEVIAFFLAQAFDTMVPAAWSMIFYMALFFGVIWGAWPIAVAITEKWLVRSEICGPASQPRLTRLAPAVRRAAGALPFVGSMG